MATVVSPFNSDYTIAQIGAATGLPTPYAGLVFKNGDPDTILVGGNGNQLSGALYEVPVTRNLSDLITGVGSATLAINVPQIDGGVAYHPSGVLFCTAYSANQIHQFKPGSTSPDKTVSLTALGVASSVGSLGFIPPGYPGAGKLMVVSWPSGNCYFLNMTADGSGTYNLSLASTGPSLPGGPEGYVYVPIGSTQFTNPSILVTEYTGGRVVAYELDTNGFPTISSARPMVTGLTNAEGASIDPTTGNYVFTTFGGTNSFFVLSGGFVPPIEVELNGGAQVAGAGVAAYQANVSVTSAGIRGGSTASVRKVIPITLSSAGVSGGGSAVDTYQANFIPSGGIQGAGQALKESPVYHYPNLPDVPIAPLTMGGTPDLAVTYSNSASGGVTLDSETRIKVGRRYLPSGNSADAPPDFAGVSVGYLNHLNPTTVKLTFNLDFKFAWNIASYVFKDYTFLWNVGKVRQYWYRVVGRAKDEQCDPIQTNDPCCLKFIMNVQARSIEDLCRKLKERKWKWPIASVERFSRPAENDAVAQDEANGINHDCNKLEPVEICKNPVCADFCVQYDLIDRWGVGTTVQVNSFKDWTGTGSVFMGGSADASFLRNGIDFTAEGEGEIEIGGEATVISSAYRHVAEGGVETGGTPGIRASNWSYVGGVWPYVNAKFSGTTTDQFEDLPSDQAWFQPNRALVNNGLTASVDLSFGRKSMFLVVKGFNLGLGDNVRVLGFKVEINRYSNSTVRDSEVYLVLDDEIISDNMADTSTTWPLGVASVKTYGGTFEQWRDPDDPDYLGEWDINDVADPDFGVAIRVSPDLIGSGITAFIDNINLYVYTEENSDTQSLRTGGEALVKSSNYGYTGTGSVTVSQGSAGLRVHRRVLNTGRGSLGPEFAAIRMGGQYALNLHYDPTDSEVEVGGVADIKSTDWRTVADGEVEIGGEARVRSSSYSWTMNGGFTLGGSAGLRNRFKYRPTGGVALDGTVNPRLPFNYVATGGLTLDGNPRIRSSAFKWVSDGNAIFIGGGADINYSDFGTLMVDIGATAFVEDVLLTFPEDDSTDTLEQLTTTITRCNCNGMPLLVPFSHNMFTSNKLTQFLNRNGLSVARVINLSYNEPNDSWQANLHFKGRSAQSNSLESWDIVFDLQCTSNVDGDEIGQNVWRFGVHYLQKNLSTLEDYDTRLLVAFIPDRICLNGDFNASITIDTSQNLVSVTPTSVVYQQLLYDNIGLFKNDYWTLNPDIQIQISQTGVPDPIPRFVVNIGA
jgi:hypothetical protein